MSEATKRFPASVFWSDDDEGFIALAPDLPGCSAFGITAEEALRELETAKEAWLEATTKAGNPIPQPSAPSADPQHSGKVLLRMPRDLHTQLARAAEAQGVSLNQYLVYLLASSVGPPPASLGTSRAASTIAASLKSFATNTTPPSLMIQAAVAELLRDLDRPTIYQRATSTAPSRSIDFAGGGLIRANWLDAPLGSVKISSRLRASTAGKISPIKPTRTRRPERAE